MSKLNIGDNMKTAEERKKSFANLDEKKLAKIDEMMQDAVDTGCREVYLDFDRFGSDWCDVEQLEVQYGYKVIRNGACLWWEVSW